MKNMKKHLALLLTVSMLLDLVIVSTAITVSADPTAILDLDMSGFSAQKVTPTDTSGEVTSGIVKSGSLASSTTLSFSQRPNAGDDNSLTQGSFQNNDNGGTTYYIDYSDPFIKPVSTTHDYDGHLMNMQFFNNDLESADNTISFWVKDLAPNPSYMKQILNYRVDYNSTNCNSFDLVVNPDGTWNVISEPWAQLTNGYHAPVTSGAFSVPDGWKHVVIINPVRSGGTKTMELYVNGEFKKNITLSIPDDATINHATVAFFGKSTATEKWWRARLNVLAAAKLGGVSVYQGALSAQGVTDIYNAELPQFTAYVLPKLFDLDIDGFVSGQTTGDSGLANKGISTTATIEAHGTAGSSGTKLVQDVLYDKDDFTNTKKVLRFVINDDSAFSGEANRTSCFKISDPAFEDQDITLSFWVNIDQCSGQTNGNAYSAIAQYNAKRDDGQFRTVVSGSTTANSRARFWQNSVESSDIYYLGSPWGTEIRASKDKKWWHHVVMTIPKWNENGQKTVRVYLDGGDTSYSTMSYSLNLDGHESVEEWLCIGSDETGHYSPVDISFADVVVYAGELSASDALDLYNDEKDFYVNRMLKNDISVTYNGSTKRVLNDIPGDAEVAVNYSQNATDTNGVRIMVGAYDDEDNLLAVNCAVMNASGSLSVIVPAEATKLNIFVWDKTDYKVLQKYTRLIRY